MARIWPKIAISLSNFNFSFSKIAICKAKIDGKLSSGALLGLHFDLLGLHFLSFWPFGPSFPFILAFWDFIFFHFDLLVFHSFHFRLLGLHFLSFWLFGLSCPFILVFKASKRANWPGSGRKSLFPFQILQFFLFKNLLFAKLKLMESFPFTLAFWAFISFYFRLLGLSVLRFLNFGFLGLNFLSFWYFWFSFPFILALLGVYFFFLAFSGLDFLSFWPFGP